MREISCQEVAARLPEFLAMGLSESRLDEVLAHMVGCSECHSSVYREMARRLATEEPDSRQPTEARRVDRKPASVA